MRRYDIAYVRIEQIKCIIYATVIVINNYIKKKNRVDINISNFKDIKMNKKLEYLKSLKNDMERLKKKMKTKDEEKAKLKLQDKIDKLKTTVDIERLRIEKNKERSRYFYNNKYYFVFWKEENKL